jgi:DNA-directed RNA polymerase specialized sigma24 family protein
LIAALPPPLRRVIKIEYLGGHGSQRQKARRLCLNYETFRGRLRRAKALLAADMV